MERRVKEHLYEVDFMRTFIILGVVCVHILSFFNLFAAPYSAANTTFLGLVTALHFTRESFMFITGLVLFITYYHKTFRARDFWLKRFKLIFIPYVVWTLIYIAFEGTYLRGFQWTPSYLASDVFMSLLTGSQFYLYFLVISMQMYLVFPLAVWFLKKFHAYHVHIFIVSFVVEIATMWFNQAVLQNMSLAHTPGWLAALINYRDRNLFTYQFWFIGGAIIAIHYHEIKEYAKSRLRYIMLGYAVMLAALWIHFGLDRLAWHEDPTMSALVLQPIMIPYSFVISAVLWGLGMKWSAARHEPKHHVFSKFIKVAAAASFGVFLAHPIMLHFMELTIYRLHTTPVERYVLIPFAIAAVYGISIVLVRIIARIPVVSYIVGQKTDIPRWLTFGTRPVQPVVSQK